MLRRASIAAGAALLSLSFAACDLAMSGFHEEARDTWSKTYPIAPDGRLEIVNANGAIQVDPGDAPQIEVHIERIARAGTQDGAKQMLQKSGIVEDVSSDRVHLSTKMPGTGLFRGNIELRYSIRAPKTVSVDLRESNGRVEVNGLTRETRMSTTNGQITGRKLEGEVRASTTNGRVDLQMASVSQDIDASTTNGTIALQLPTNARADISARVTNGGIGIDGLPSLKSDDEHSRRRFSGQLNGGGHTIRLQTTNGSINISGRGGASGGDKTDQPVER